MDSDLDLDAIGAKAQFVLDHPYNPAGQERIKTLLREDVPALVAECRRLRGLVELVEETQYFRLPGGWLIDRSGTPECPHWILSRTETLCRGGRGSTRWVPISGYDSWVAALEAWRRREGEEWALGEAGEETDDENRH